MITTREKTFSVGKYLVSPLTHLDDADRYTASVSIRSGRGSSTHDRIFRFAARFTTREGARRYAIEQGVRWTQAPSSNNHPSLWINKELRWPKKN